MNVRDAFYEVLRSHGITTIFGNPGSNELPMLSDLPDDRSEEHTSELQSPC